MIRLAQLELTFVDRQTRVRRNDVGITGLNGVIVSRIRNRNGANFSNKFTH